MLKKQKKNKSYSDWTCRKLTRFTPYLLWQEIHYTKPVLQGN